MSITLVHTYYLLSLLSLSVGILEDSRIGLAVHILLEASELVRIFIFMEYTCINNRAGMYRNTHWKEMKFHFGNLELFILSSVIMSSNTFDKFSNDNHFFKNFSYISEVSKTLYASTQKRRIKHSKNKHSFKIQMTPEKCFKGGKRH